MIALALGLLAVPFLLYSLSQPILCEFGFATLPYRSTWFVSLWGIGTLFGTLLMILSVIAGDIAIVLSIKTAGAIRRQGAGGGWAGLEHSADGDW